LPASEGHRMRDKQVAKNQPITESTRLHPRFAKSEKSATRHKHAEQALRESEENYRQLTESISDVFFEMDKDLRCTYWNRASEKLTGVSAKDAIGKSLLELFPDILITRKTKRVYLDVLRTQQPQTFINEYLFGGKDFFFDISVYPSKNGLSVFAKDITERIHSEEKLREKEEFNFALFQHNPIQTIVVDRGGRVLKVNMAKRKSGDRLPKIGDVMYKDYASKHEIDMHAELMECIRSGKKKWFHAMKYGDKFLDITIASFPDGAIITSLDITEHKRAEEEIKNSQLQLRNLTAHLQSVREEERTHIAREMHDELGQALTAMKMDLSWLDSRLPKDQRSLLEKTKSMSKLADATLQTVKKISTQLRPGLLDDLGLPAAIEWQAEEFQTRTGIKCAITVDPEDIILDKDRSTAIFRIFQETLTNVARHAKATKVKVSLKKKAGKIELKVRDNGKGITEEQASNPKSFGLIGIKERAYYLNGKVVINGLQDKGTTLTIGIPLPKKGKTR
jgi:PAS domain S-box-containing protein